MKRIPIYIIAMLLCIFVSSCKRRPLTTADYMVIVNIEIEKDIVNHTVEKDPSLMRCIFYDSETGGFVTQAFLPPTGGQVSLIPSREYDVLVYNFDTESTDIHFLDADGMSVMFEDPGLANMKLQRNQRTDFVGQVLSDAGTLNPREYKAETTVYHNIAEDTVISDIIYDMSGHDALQFASESGQKMTLENIYITGDIWTIELGEYRGSSYVNYNNELNNVVLKDLVCTSKIECHEWYFSPAVIAYGNTVVNNCSMTGATTICGPVTDKHGVVHEVIPVDFGVRNESDAIINGGTFGTFFAWTHAVVDIYGATIDTLYCGTCDSTKHSWMTIHSGTTIDKVICCEPRCPYGGKEYSTTMTIKNGAVIGSLQLVSTDVEFLIIEEGAKVGKITCEGVEYTYKELREAMGL